MKNEAASTVVHSISSRSLLRNPSVTIAAVIAAILLIWCVNISLPLRFGFYHFNHRFYFLSVLYASLLSVLMVWKSGRLDGRLLLGSLLFGSLAFAPSYPYTSVATAISFYGAYKIIRLHRLRHEPFLKNPKSGWKRAIAVGMVAGIGLAAVNTVIGVYADGLSIHYVDGNLTMFNPLIAIHRGLVPGISEEILFRYALYAFCLYCINDKPVNRWTKILCILLMVVPHNLTHFSDLFLQSPVEACMNFIILGIIFGLPYVILLLRFGLASAIIAHSFVDFMKYLLFGV